MAGRRLAVFPRRQPSAPVAAPAFTNCWPAPMAHLPSNCACLAATATHDCPPPTARAANAIRRMPLGDLCRLLCARSAVTAIRLARTGYSCCRLPVGTLQLLAQRRGTGLPAGCPSAVALAPRSHCRPNHTRGFMLCNAAQPPPPAHHPPRRSTAVPAAYG
ncbi:hypothetical protein I4F81_002427 [Pyropia yezoensis]|uniref:Uncharacterized protein n=1 Tax=Pyropia yezoensis TaxID=2788 RepID=A0ACC3BQH0_PYRYE|nr:hypothetical protein I4F81_002427 [Neopyropia yezoensis]